MTIDQYINNINQRYRQANATEHTFRGDLQQLIESLVPDVRATNEPKRQTCGAPDYILTRKEIPVGFIEAKDIGDKDLDGAKKTGNKEQFDRYKASLSNLLFTDYIHFHLYRDGQYVTKVAIGELSSGAITPLPTNYSSIPHRRKQHRYESEIPRHKGVHQRYAVFRQRTRTRLELLYWRLPTRSEMAQRPQRP
jgi:hypothetical protein